MSLEDFSREVQGKRPKNRSLLDRSTFTDEDGCSYDQQVCVTPLHTGVGLAFMGGMLLITWAEGGEAWAATTDWARMMWGFLT